MTNKVIKSSVVAAAFVVASLSAQAADMPVKTRPKAPETLNWAGCYLGGDLGYAWARDFDTETIAGTGAVSVTSPGDSANPNGVKVGGYLGCNWQVGGPYVIGVEGDFEWANLRGTATFPNTGPPANFYDTRISDQSSFRGRIGYALEPRLLLYATGGVSFGRVTEHDVVGVTSQSTDTSGTRTGFSVGGGFDYAFTGRWIGRLEYRYSNFGTSNYNTVLFPGFNESHRTSENAIRLGLAYKFW